MSQDGGPTLQQMRHFVAAAETGQISRAATRCRISQPSMSASLNKLEQMVGRTLLRRNQGPLLLTPEGERFLRYAQAVLTTLRDALDDVRHTDGPVAGPLSIGVTDTITGYLLPSMLQTLRRHLPEVSLTVVERDRAEIEAALSAGEVDFAIVLTANLTEPGAFACETLLRSKRQLWLSPEHPLAPRECLSLAEVAEHDYVLLDMDEHVDVVRKYWEGTGLSPRTVFRSKSIEGLRSLVAQGLGVTILSDLVYRSWSHDAGRILRRSLRDPVPSMDVGIVTRPDAEPSRAGRAAMDLLRTEVRNIARQTWTGTDP